MKKYGLKILATAIALMMTACGNTNSEDDIKNIEEENESLRAELSSLQSAADETPKITETESTTLNSETETETTTEITTTIIEENPEYRPQMYLKYVRPCAEGINVMTKSEVETLLSEIISEIDFNENDNYNFYIFSDDEYEYTINVSKGTEKVFLVAMSLKDYSFNVYIKENDSGDIIYTLDGEYGSNITKDFKENADSLEESEEFIFGDKKEYTDANKDNPETISLEEYNQIEIDMFYSDVVYIIGGYGEKIAESDIGGIHTSMYQFDGEGDIGANAILTFQNGQLISKAQSGLK